MRALQERDRQHRVRGKTILKSIAIKSLTWHLLIMLYSTLGPFKKKDAKLLEPKIKTPEDYSFWKESVRSGIIMENAALYALQYVVDESLESCSHHGGGSLFTVTYKGKDVVLCQTLRPFCACYLGESDDMGILKKGFSLFYASNNICERPEEKIDSLFEIEFSEEKIVTYVKHLYSADNTFYGSDHICMALAHIGIKWENPFKEMEERLLQETTERLKASEKFKMILAKAKMAKQKHI